MQNPLDLKEVLTWIVGAGAPAIVLLVLSFVVEQWPAWHRLPRQVKFLAPMILSVLLSYGAATLLKYPQALAEIQPAYQIIVAACLAYLASQKNYAELNKTSYALKAKNKASLEQPRWTSTF